MRKSVQRQPNSESSEQRQTISPPSGGRLQSVAIIGGGLGGLSAAIHLRLAGHDVTIYEANDLIGGRANMIERDGFRFDTGPSLLNYPWVFEELFRAAGRKMQDYVTLLAVDPSISFQWPDGTRFQLSSSFGRLLEECEKIEPGSQSRLVAFLRDAEAKYRVSFDKLVTRNEDNFVKWLGRLSPGEMKRTAVWRSLDRELKRFFRSRYIREAFGSYAMYLGGSPFDLPGLFSILPYGEIAYGLYLPKGGVYGLVRGIERLARELGVTILTGKRVSKIATRNGRVAGIELADGSFQKSRIVVSNVDVGTTDTEMIEAEPLAAKLRARAAKIKMTPGVLTFYWGIRGKVDNIGHHTIFLPDDYRAVFDDLLKAKRIARRTAFYVSVASETDAGLAPAGCSAMFVLVPTPLLSETNGIDWQATTRAIKQQVLERLRQHGIDLSPQRIVFEEAYTPSDWRQKFGLYNGSAFGAAHTLGQVGPLRPRNYSKEIEGLYYVGASTTPGTGMPMVVLSGKMTAERIKEALSGEALRADDRALSASNET